MTSRPRSATTRCIAHVDVDAFLASVEQALHPELRGKPVVVGGMPNSRNLVMSCSYEARAFGVRPGMRSAEAARRCPDAIFRHGDSQAAGRLREEVARILYRFSPKVEITSIDDFFVDLTGCERLALADHAHSPDNDNDSSSPTSETALLGTAPALTTTPTTPTTTTPPLPRGHSWRPWRSPAGAARAACQEMLRAVHAEVGLPLTIGIGSNRTLARLAGKLAKPAVRDGRSAGRGGFAEILPGYERAFLERLPVAHLPGVGHRTQRLLERFAIRTVGELARVPREVLYGSFGTAGLVLHERARGIDPTPVEAGIRFRSPAGSEGHEGSEPHENSVLEPRPPKSIRRDSTFEPEEGRRAIVEAMLAYLVERAAQRLRRFDLAAGSVQVRLVYVDTRPASVKHADPNAFRAGTVEKTHTLRRPSDSTDELWRVARELLRALPRRRALVKRVGLSLIRLQPAGGWQHHLFDEADGAPRTPGVAGTVVGEGHSEDPPHPGLLASEAGRSAHESPTTPPHPSETRADRQRRLDESLDLLRRKHGFGRILRGTSLPLRDVLPWAPEGYRLRTPSLNQ